ncbi:MAG: GNAT family protein [Armatimonadota bacterium]
MEVAPTSYNAGDFVIRAYRPGDGAAMAKAVRESYEHLQPWMPWASPNHSSAASEEYVGVVQQNYEAQTDFALGIWKGDELAGGTGFHLRWGPVDWKVAEIGMWIAYTEANRGLGTAALQALLDWGFTDWGWHRLIWRCDDTNVASTRVAEKCGMVQEAILREDRLHVNGQRNSTKLFAMLRSDWEATRRQ